MNIPHLSTLRSGLRELGNANSPQRPSPQRNLLALTVSALTVSALTVSALTVSALTVALPMNRAWAADAEHPQKVLPLAGEVFQVDGRTAFVILPAAANLHPNLPTPWVWYAPTLPALPEARENWMFERFLAAGIAVDGNGPYDTYLLESRDLTGPWKLASYMKAFGEQAYFVNLPSRFIAADGKTLWLSYSHSWGHDTPNPPGSRYAWCLLEFRLLTPTNNPLSPGLRTAP